MNKQYNYDSICALIIFASYVIIVVMNPQDLQTPFKKEKKVA